MHVSKVETTDDLILNSELAHVIAGEGEVHLFKGRQGYRVRLLSKSGTWRMVNWRNPDIADDLAKRFNIRVRKDEGDSFRAKADGVRVSAVADDQRLAIALAALKVPTGRVPLGFAN